MEANTLWKKGVVFQLVPLAAIACCLVWAYWPTLKDLVAVWNKEPDYSHGFIVPLLVAAFLFVRRDRFPGWNPARGPKTGLGWLVGLLLIAMAVLMRVGGALVYLDSADGWSLPLLIAGVVCFLYGLKVFWWACPAIAYLWFAIPLPYTFERLLRLPLQGIAAKLSTIGLQILGQPAITQGHTILLESDRLEVADACSGMRIFMAIAALATASILLVRRQWWENVLILLLVAPVALLANATRIVATGLLYQYATSDAARTFSHDLAGWATIGLAAAMFGFVLWYLAKLFPHVEHACRLRPCVRG